MLMSIKIFLLLTLITGIIYPLLITGLANLFYKDKAGGSLTKINDQPAGSSLIGQAFDSSIYFWPRPSQNNYDPLPSAGSNLALTNERLRIIVSERESKFLDANDLEPGTRVPSEMVFSSGSGLDPHISPESAILQAGRIARARNFSPDQRQELSDLIERLTQKPQFNIFGQDRINVFILNLELDKIK